MVATLESLPTRAQGLRSSGLKRPVAAQGRGCKVLVDPDGSVRAFVSLQEKRSLFGLEQVWICKVQAGIVVYPQRPDWVVRAAPSSVQLSGRIFEGVEVVQSIEFHRGQPLGYLRRLKLRNGTPGTIRLRVLDLADPTAAHFGDSSSRWGSLGVNAFNRESHVAMDEVSDPPSARVVGSYPPPSRFYMTADRSRAQSLIASGDLPEATAGMSGQVLILSLHELELAPSEAKEILFVSIYSPGKLEEALSDFGNLESIEKRQPLPRPYVACSEQGIADASGWALSAIEAGAFSGDSLDRYEVLRALTYAGSQLARKVMSDAKATMRKDGSLPHSLDPTRPGVLETSVLLQSAAINLVLAQDKKLARAWYPMVKKLGVYLLASSKDFAVQTDPSLPHGWRRHLGRGFPTGEIPEVSLAAAGALAAASQVSRLVSKSDDAAKFRERAEMISDRVKKKLVDGRGFLCLCLDSSGRTRSDETVDMAVASYRHQFQNSAEQTMAHRLLETDFATPCGPRCVPTSNQLYFNRSYGRGQLGGVWPRAALAHALVCYHAGLGGSGSLALGKVAKLVVEDAPRLGASPGEFPQWVDVDAAEAHGEESDAVAAARFLEVILEGELGLRAAPEKPALSPASSSGIGWLLAHDFWAGEPFSAFLGRAAGSPHLFFAGGKVDSKSGMKFAKAERLDLPVKGVHCVTFYAPGQVLCVGNALASQARFTLTFPPRASELSRHLSVPLEAYDPAKGVWSKTGTVRVSPTMSFEVSLEPNEWKAFRASTG